MAVAAQEPQCPVCLAGTSGSCVLDKRLIKFKFFVGVDDKVEKLYVNGESIDLGKLTPRPPLPGDTDITRCGFPMALHIE